MLRFAMPRFVLGCVAVLAMSLASSTASAQHHGGGHHSGYGGGHGGGGHYGGGHYGGHHGGYHGGHYGGHHGGYHNNYYGGGFGFSIGTGSLYGLGYSGLGYGGLGYGAFGYPGPGYAYGGLGGVGYNNYGLGSYGLGLTSGLGIGRFDYVSPYSSAYRGYYGSRYSPYYNSLGRSNVDISIYAAPSTGYVVTPNYQPSDVYSGSTTTYGVPGYNSEYAHQPTADGQYSSGRFDETYPSSTSPQFNGTGDLRPGMVLPDGSTVISVEPLSSSPTVTSGAVTVTNESPTLAIEPVEAGNSESDNSEASSSEPNTSQPSTNEAESAPKRGEL